MLGAKNDLCLHLRRETDKVVAVSADAHDEIAVCFGIFSGFFKGFLVYYVDLKLKAAALDIGLDKALHYLK